MAIRPRFKRASFSRASTAYGRITGAEAASGVPRYEDGPWDGHQALVVEEGTTAQPANAFFADGVADWTLSFSGGAAASKESVDGGLWGGKLARITVTTPGTLMGHVQFRKSIGAVANGQKIAIQIRAKATNNFSPNFTVNESVSPYAYFGGRACALTNEFQTFTFVVTATKDTTANMNLDCGLAPAGTAIDVDFMIAEPGKAYSTSPTIGTRAAESLTIPLAGMSPAELTIEAWGYFSSMARRQVTDQFPALFRIKQSGSSNSALAFRHPPDAAIYEVVARSALGVYFIQFADSLIPDGYHLIKVTLSAGIVKVYIDNVYRGQVDIGGPLVDWEPVMYIGSNDGTSSFWNEPIGPVRLSSIDRSGETADLTGPLADDEHTCGLWLFDGRLLGELFPHELTIRVGHPLHRVRVGHPLHTVKVGHPLHRVRVGRA
jgi:hypothetical protein